MKNISCLVISLLLFAVLPFTAFADEYFVIDHYQVDIDVEENNAYRITEVIDVDFQAERHGIYRKIPLSFDSMRVKISNISVPGHEVDIEKDRDYATLRIGSADIFVNGKVTYTISYTYDVGADNLSDMDEFNHNIIGNDWDTTIGEVDFRINMPKSFAAEYVNCTSGDYGSTDNSKVEWEVKGSTITGKTLAPLSNYQGLTVALPLPEGYWVGAQTHRPPGWLLFKILGYPLYAIVIVLAFLLWYRYGRDNKLFPAVEFEAPDGMTPSEIGYIIDGRVDSKDVTSLIIYWAEKGCIEIEEETKGKAIFKQKVLHLTKLKELDDDAESYEKTLFSKLFSYGNGNTVSTTDLTNKFYTSVSKAKTDIRKSFTDNPDRRIYVKGNKGFTALTALFAALPIISILMEGFLSFTGETGIAIIFAIPFSLFLIIPTFVLGSAIGGSGGGEQGRRGKIIFFILFGGFSLVFFAFFIVTGGGIPIYKYAAAVVSGIITSVFISVMSRRTEYGDRILEKTLGFKEFIKEAEKEKLEEMFESNPQYFYNILPYAMVLNLSDKWSAHFEGMTVEPPNWYRGYHYNTFSAAAFTSTLNTSFKSMNSSMTSSPSSSGSSGSSSSGGFSGGGSGGGGGGSW
ncbi:MAG: DUF2207 domain-containing protein [Spirochaetales bacterium]|uniref:DUF2207 domain-containing protein n=1 Tax=Candidatus Thalassospirochaeta sargassi TaxID=3119039 RepID=A0AAJ1IJS6_9SPIO|nr:DUF2207 domain-containing protein [Spirochaetales bacterium]